MKKWVKNKMLTLFLSLVMVMSMNDISVSAASTIQRARKNGHKVFLCTGRNMAIIGEEIRCVGFDGIIASAGGHVEIENHVLFDSILPEETIQECLSIFHAHGLYCRIENTEGIYTDPQMEELLQAANPDKTNSELIRMQKEIEAGIAI